MVEIDSGDDENAPDDIRELFTDRKMKEEYKRIAKACRIGCIDIINQSGRLPIESRKILSKKLKMIKRSKRSKK